MPRVTRAEKKEVADAAADRIKQFGPTANLPVRGDPPAPLREGEGEAEARLGGEYIVTMSGAGFMALWRYCEAHALQLHNNPSAYARPFEAAFLELVESFRRSSGQTFEQPAVNGTKPKWGGRSSVKAPAEQSLPAPRKAWGKTAKS